MKKLILSFVFCLAILSVNSQVKIKITDVPRYFTPLSDTLFFTGSINNWNEADNAYIMLLQSDGTYELDVTSTAGSLIEFKFTRGSWASVETKLDGSFLPDRSFTYVNGDTIFCQLENWNDMLGWHTALSNTYILDLDFDMPQLNRKRRIWLCLPDDYFTSANHYPVVYMHDGQNLFDAVYAPFGEWNVDSTMQVLFTQFSPSAIIVGIDNGGIDRLNEYSPWVNTQYGGGQGALYTEFIVNTLKPYIDNHFRTLPARNYTAIAGSSMGGLISFYAAMQYPNVFSKAAVFSPSFWFSDSLQTYLNNISYTLPQRFYFLAGQNESASMVSDIQDVIAKLQLNGFTSTDINLLVKTDGQHSEWFWKREFGDAYQWLFQVVTSLAKPYNESCIIYSSEAREILYESYSERTEIYLYDLTGRLITRGNGNSLKLSDNIKGLYVAVVKADNILVSRKLFVE